MKNNKKELTGDTLIIMLLILQGHKEEDVAKLYNISQETINEIKEEYTDVLEIKLVAKYIRKPVDPTLTEKEFNSEIRLIDMEYMAYKKYNDEHY